jgi:hypothetical protein
MGSRLQRQQALTAIQALSHSGLNSVSLRQKVLSHLKPAVAFDASSLMTMDPTTLLVTNSVVSGLRPGGARVAMTNEYLEADVNKLATLARGAEHVGRLDAAAQGQSRRFRELLPAAGFGSEMRAAFVADTACWGAAFFYRHQDRPPFSAEEAQFLTKAGPLIAVGLRNALLLSRAQAAPDAGATGLLMLDAEDRVVSISEAAERHLHALGQEWGTGVLPSAIYGLAARARTLAGGDAPPGAEPARLRVRTSSGGWVAVHGTVLGGQVAVMFEQARPAEVTPLLFAAYDLSPREVAVT